MATVYTTAINACRTTTQGELSEVVREVSCTITGTDDVVTSCTFALPVKIMFGPADPASFTPFEEITEAQMIAWVEAQTDQLAGTYGHIDYVVQKEVALAQFQPTPLPWAPPEPTPTPAPEPAPAE